MKVEGNQKNVNELKGCWNSIYYNRLKILKNFLSWHEGDFAMAKGGTQFLFRKMEQTICLIVASALWLHAKRKVAPVAPFWSDEAGIRTEPLSSGPRVRACLPLSLRSMAESMQADWQVAELTWRKGA